jgi:hypothetical protein
VGRLLADSFQGKGQGNGETGGCLVVIYCVVKLNVRAIHVFWVQRVMIWLWVGQYVLMGACYPGE